MAIVRVLAMAIAVLILAVPVELPGCGGGVPQALFVLERQPEDADGFLRGKLGILQRSYGTPHLVIAYRYLIGVGLSEAERAALAAPEERPGDPSAWVDARGKVVGPGQVATYRPVVQPGYFAISLNCGTDAFRTAARTLEEREQRFGKGSPLLAEWLRGQDTVFSNCGAGANIPDAIAEGALRADREYQRAAAKFYAMQFAEAGAEFERIALDRESPWSPSAPYLAARCLIRAEKFQEADARLAQVMADPGLTAWHDRARRLRNFVALRTRPAERVRELGQSLAASHAEATIKQDLIDYSRWERAGSPGEELTDWVSAVRGSDRKPVLEKWRATRNVAWLVAALGGTKRGDEGAGELLEAAGAVDRGHPGYVTATYESLRLMPEARARVKAGELLAMALPAGSRNLVMAARMGMARNWDEFLRDATREAVGESGIDGEMPGGDEGRYLAYDAGAVMNQGVPVSMLEAAAKSSRLPAEVRAELARTASARRLVLAEAPEFDGVLMLLRSPGISPWVRSGYGRRLYSYNAGVKPYYNASRLEDYRDNWWAAREGSGGEVKAPGFLTAEERQQGAAEWKKLRALPSGVRWLGEQTLKFAEAHPEDPRVAEALYRVVRVSRYSVGDGEISKKAFEVLHGRYEGTEWAKRTPYWFK